MFVGPNTIHRNCVINENIGSKRLHASKQRLIVWTSCHKI